MTTIHLATHSPAGQTLSRAKSLAGWLVGPAMAGNCYFFSLRKILFFRYRFSGGEIRDILPIPPTRDEISGQQPVPVLNALAKG